MKLEKRFFPAAVVVCCLVLIAVAGCGKKGPPIPPPIKGNKLAAPFDLKVTRTADRIILSWKHDVDPETASAEPEAFDVFMARRTFEDCEGCPFVFELVRSIPVPVQPVHLTLVPGYRYYFRVQAVGENDMRSDYSKTIQFEYAE